MTLPRMVITSSAIGGVAAWITGGDFLSGAFHGLNVALLNHGMHYDELYSDKDGNIHGHLRDLVVYYRKPNPMELGYVLSSSSNAVAVADAAGKSLKRNGGNSTVGNNGKFYFHADGERGFNGNQHVKTIKLTKIGASITKVTGSANIALNSVDVGKGIYDDMVEYNNSGYTNGYNTVHAISKAYFSYQFAKAGLIIGSEIGSFFGGVGIIPGAIIGGFIGGIIGAYAGAEFGGELVDELRDL